MSEPITCSPCINKLISYNNEYNSTLWKEFREHATTEFEKWFYNISKPYGEPDLETTFNPSSFTSKLFDKYVPNSGPARTAYGEFIRAYNKVMYRWLNDGDDPIYGPYSAVVDQFLEDWKDRPFRLHDGCLEMYAPPGGEFKEEEIENLMNLISRNVCVFDCMSKDAEKLSDIFFAILDCINDKLKGVDEKNNYDCAEYYQNSLEYQYPKIYKFLTETLKLYNVRYIDNNWDKNIDEMDDIIYGKITYINKVDLFIKIHPDPNAYVNEWKEYNIDLDNLKDIPDETFKEMKTLVDNEKEYLTKRYGGYGER